jgi:ferredoxin-NADP reductase
LEVCGRIKFQTEVTKTLQRTADVKSVRFFRPNSFEYKPGQWMNVTIQTKKQKLRKHFTMSSSPTEKNFIELTKKLTGHPFANALDALEPGDKVEIDAPYGEFILDEKASKIGMLSGGIGITPLRSMCKYATDQKLENSIILLYGNNTVKDIAFRKEFEELQKVNSNLNVVHTLAKPPSSWNGYSGYIDAEIIRQEIPDYQKRQFYTCGPPSMVDAMQKLLEELKIPKSQMKTENFAGY